MISKQAKKRILWLVGIMLCLFTDVVFAAAVSGGIGTIAQNVTFNLLNLAKLITAGAYVAGFGFAVGAIVKFKAHKDNPTQVPVGTPIALLGVAAALMFAPSVFKATGITLFGKSGVQATISGVPSF